MKHNLGFGRLFCFSLFFALVCTGAPLQPAEDPVDLFFQDQAELGAFSKRHDATRMIQFDREAWRALATATLPLKPDPKNPEKAEKKPRKKRPRVKRPGLAERFGHEFPPYTHQDPPDRLEAALASLTLRFPVTFGSGPLSLETTNHSIEVRKP